MYRKALLICALAVLPLCACDAPPQESPTQFVHFGEMREAVGMGQDQGRVGLAEILGKPHFYGVGALEGLRGEITILDSAAVVTRVTEDGRPQPVKSGKEQATMLAGRSIAEWTETTLTEDVPPERFDETIAKRATAAGIDVSRPFVFVALGTLTDVRLHVLNGACPLHARMNKIELAEEVRPYELETERVTGTIVGLYAADSVGKLTHPATNTHSHLIYTDEGTGERVTGHLERAGLEKGAVLKLPAAAD